MYLVQYATCTQTSCIYRMLFKLPRSLMQPGIWHLNNQTTNQGVENCSAQSYPGYKGALYFLFPFVEMFSLMEIHQLPANIKKK